MALMLGRRREAKSRLAELKEARRAPTGQHLAVLWSDHRSAFSFAGTEKLAGRHLTDRQMSLLPWLLNRTRLAQNAQRWQREEYLDALPLPALSDDKR